MTGSDSIQLKKSYKAVLGEAGVPVEPIALDSAGKPVPDAPIDFTYDAAVVRVGAGKLEPVGLGRTELRAQAGRASASAKVEVVRKVTGGPLDIPDGGTLTWQLSPGRYLVEIVAEAGKGDGVSLRWVGADCKARPESTKHRFRCSLDEDANLRVENPTVFGLGRAAQGFFNIYEVPPGA